MNKDLYIELLEKELDGVKRAVAVQHELVVMLENSKKTLIKESKKDNYDNGMEINRLKRDNADLKKAYFQAQEDINDLQADYALEHEIKERLVKELSAAEQKINDIQANYAEEAVRLREKNKKLKEKARKHKKKNIVVGEK